MIWRPVNDSSKYKLVRRMPKTGWIYPHMYNNNTTNWRIRLNIDEQLPVRQGDAIGFEFEGHNAIPFNHYDILDVILNDDDDEYKLSCRDDIKYHMTQDDHLRKNYVTGKTYDISESFASNCHMYSFQAVIKHYDNRREGKLQLCVWCRHK